MSTKHDISKPHRATFKTASKGSLQEPAEAYGHWAYWRAGENGRFGWYSKP